MSILGGWQTAMRMLKPFCSGAVLRARGNRTGVLRLHSLLVSLECQVDFEDQRLEPSPLMLQVRLALGLVAAVLEGPQAAVTARQRNGGVGLAGAGQDVEEANGRFGVVFEGCENFVEGGEVADQDVGVCIGSLRRATAFGELSSPRTKTRPVGAKGAFFSWGTSESPRSKSIISVQFVRPI
jgi:hypothetical protein